MKEMEKIPFGNLDTTDPSELEQLEKMLEEKFEHTVDTTTPKGKAS